MPPACSEGITNAILLFFFSIDIMHQVLHHPATKIKILTGDQILLNIYAANRDEAAWSSPTDFLPERWSTEIGERRNISFGKGKRVCPAQNAAIEALIDFRQVIEANYGVRFFNVPCRGGILAL